MTKSAFILDCDVLPVFDSVYWEVVKHLPTGDVPVGGVSTYQTIAGDKDGKISPQSLLHQLLEFKNRWRTLNARVLDFMLENQQLIPESFADYITGRVRARRVLFLGTIFRDKACPRERFVRYMYRVRENRWGSGFQLITEPYDAFDSVVAVLPIRRVI